MINKNSQPVSLYGSSISYFTGKMEMYFKLKGIDYRLKPLTHPHLAAQIKSQVGSSQMPAVKLPDGRWMTDSSAMIQWFEQHYQESPLLPSNAVVRFFSLLLEDYADEWLWRPAMHYRWHYPVGAHFAGTHLAHEIATGISAPVFLKRWSVTRRQRKGFTTGDGIDNSNYREVEQIYLDTLEHLSGVFESQPFMLGQQPSLADVGFAGPFVRHFGLDPVPAEIMRQRAPAVYAWLGRMWNSPPISGEQSVEAVPNAWGPIIKDVGYHYLPYLNANAEAVAAGKNTFNVTSGGIQYRNARTSRYRVACLAALRLAFNELQDHQQQEAKALLQANQAWEALWEKQELPCTQSEVMHLPFWAGGNMLDVY